MYHPPSIQSTGTLTFKHLGALQADSSCDPSHQPCVDSLAAAVAHDTSTTTSASAAVDTSSVSPTGVSGAALPSTPATRAELSQAMQYMYDLAVAQNSANGSDKSCHLPLPPF